MIRLLPTVLLTVYLGGSLAGCSNGDDSPATTTATASVPATVAPKTRTPFPTATPIPALNLGQSATLENGLRVTLNTIVYNPKLTEGGQNRQPPAGFTFVLADITIENTVFHEQFLELAITCGDGRAGPVYSYTDSGSLDLTKSVAVTASTRGEVLLGIPEGCEARRLRARPQGGSDAPRENIKTKYWTLP